MSNYAFQIRVTGILLQDEKILLVKQPVNGTRNWSLPGGRAEAGEKLEDSVIREIKEET
jgi:ADP-ribose pyrophosphatase